MDVEISLPESLKKDMFVEGFVRLVPVGENHEAAVPLTVPYGEWDKPQNHNPAGWEKDAFLGYTVLWNDQRAQFPMGYDPTTGKFNMDRIVISPNAVLPGVFPTFTALRNLKGEMIQYLGDSVNISVSRGSSVKM